MRLSANLHSANYFSHPQKLRSRIADIPTEVSLEIREIERMQRAGKGKRLFVKLKIRSPNTNSAEPLSDVQKVFADLIRKRLGKGTKQFAVTAPPELSSARVSGFSFVANALFSVRARFTGRRVLAELCIDKFGKARCIDKSVHECVWDVWSLQGRVNLSSMQTGRT